MIRSAILKTSSMTATKIDLKKEAFLHDDPPAIDAGHHVGPACHIGEMRKEAVKGCRVRLI